MLDRSETVDTNVIKIPVQVVALEFNSTWSLVVRLLTKVM